MAAAKVRIAAFTALALGVVALLAVVVFGGTTHELNLRFIDAGQLVKGDLVEVAGRSIGSVDEITLTNDNRANVKVKIKGDDFWPLTRGTVAGIRAVGLSGVANRYVEVTPGPDSGDPIADGGTIDTTRTRPIVDLDQVLTALDAPTREQLQQLIRNGSTIFDGNAKEANDAITYLNPAVAQSHALLSELDRDTAAVGRLVSTSAAVSTTLARRRTDLQGSISNTARTLEAVAAERTALQDVLTRAPGFLRQAGRTLDDTSDTLRSVKPVLRELRPAAAPLAAVLRQLPAVGRDARPAVGQLRDLLPAVRKALLAVPSLDHAARPALRSTTSALLSALPIAAGLRPYAPDVVAGLFNGFTGTTGGYYDANGHYARIQLVTGVAGLSGTLGALAAGQLQTGLTARCPGAAVESADDKTNPNPEDPSVCDTGHDKK
jgi:phospholipid/cholesterol/gamma-HCH transport system substrate-binding protein